MPNKASTFCPNGVKPAIGDFVSGTVLGKNDRGTFIWTPCPQCGYERWVKQTQIENLELMAHKQEHLPSMNVQNIIARQDKRIAQLESRVALLEADNTRLESMLSGGRDSVPDNHEYKAL